MSIFEEARQGAITRRNSDQRRHGALLLKRNEKIHLCRRERSSSFAAAVVYEKYQGEIVSLYE